MVLEVLGGGMELPARLGRLVLIPWWLAVDSPVLPTAAVEVRAVRRVLLKPAAAVVRVAQAWDSWGPGLREETAAALWVLASLKVTLLAYVARQAVRVALRAITPFTGARAAAVLMLQRRGRLAGQVYSGLGPGAAAAVPTIKPVEPVEPLIRSPLAAAELAEPRIIPALLARLALRVAEAAAAAAGLLIPVELVALLEPGAAVAVQPITVRLVMAERVRAEKFAFFLYDFCVDICRIEPRKRRAYMI